MRSSSTASSPQQSNTKPAKPSRTGTARVPRSPDRPAQLPNLYGLPEHTQVRPRDTLIRCFSLPSKRSWRSPTGKCSRPACRPISARSPKRGQRHLYRAKPRQPESPPSTLRSHPFTCKRFHVLSNSLFKVLFNFPSPYLFAIGLVPVFSLRWSLPPTLGCILKQPDSGERQRDRGRHRRGLTPAMGQAPIRRTRTT